MNLRRDREKICKKKGDLKLFYNKVGMPNFCKRKQPEWWGKSPTSKKLLPNQRLCRIICIIFD